MLIGVKEYLNELAMVEEDNNENHTSHEDDHSRLSLLFERYRRLTKRVDAIEKTQQEGLSLMNKIVGGITFLVAAGLFIGWLFTIISGMQIFR
jgi:hypothetical protein